MGMKCALRYPVKYELSLIYYVHQFSFEKSISLIFAELLNELNEFCSCKRNIKIFYFLEYIFKFISRIKKLCICICIILVIFIYNG